MGLENLKNLSPMFDNDKVVKPQIPTGNLSFIASADDYSPKYDNNRTIPAKAGSDIYSNINVSLFSVPSFTDFSNYSPISSNHILDKPYDKIQITSAESFSPVFNHDIVNKPYEKEMLIKMYPPTQMIETFGEITSTVNNFIIPPIPGGFTKNMENITDSKIAPGGGPVYVQPTNMIDKFGTIASPIQQSLNSPSTTSWESLYNADHTPRLAGLLGYQYSSNVSSDNLNIYNHDKTNWYIAEPYIVTNIGSRDAGGRIAPGDRGLKDASRLSFWASNHPGWWLEQSLYQFLNPRSHRMFSESKVLTSGIPVAGTGVKFRQHRGYDLAGGSLFGISWPPTGDIYTNTIMDLTPGGLGEFASKDAASENQFLYGNFFQSRTDDWKKFVAPIPFDGEIMPLPVRDYATKQKMKTVETPIADEGMGYGMKSNIPFISRRLTYTPRDEHKYAQITKGLIPNFFYSLPAVGDGNEIGYPKGGTFDNIEKRVSDKHNTVLHKDMRGVFGNFGNIENLWLANAIGTTDTYNSYTPSKTVNTSMDSRVEKRSGMFGDFMTMTELKLKPNAKTLEDAYGDSAEDIESPTNGMPFYFKDLRDNTYLIFRGYLDGITENISPSWAEQTYIGRSEPTYLYERATRDIAFNLNVSAQSEQELDIIYKKLNRLTSLCYPEYKKDYVGGLLGKTRMKPPLTKFRLGELYGSQDNEVLGFIKSLSYTIPDNTPWETKNGKRVPKIVTAAISYQVLHNETPSLRFAQKQESGNPQNAFYGINSKVGV